MSSSIYFYYDKKPYIKFYDCYYPYTEIEPPLYTWSKNSYDLDELLSVNFNELSGELIFKVKPNIINNLYAYVKNNFDNSEIKLNLKNENERTIIINTNYNNEIRNVNNDNCKDNTILSIVNYGSLNLINIVNDLLANNDKRIIKYKN